MLTELRGGVKVPGPMDGRRTGLRFSDQDKRLPFSDGWWLDQDGLSSETLSSGSFEGGVSSGGA